MTWFQRLLILTIALTFVLVVIGGIVRATGSGLGCPDWPRCHGELIPPAERHTLIEFSHRTMAAVVGFVFLGVTYFTFRTERRNPLVFWLAFTAGLLLVAQIILGGITVKRELPPEIVALHLATAMTFMAVLIITATISLRRGAGAAADPRALDDPFTRLAILSAAGAFATLVLGSYISENEAALACSGWPLCNGSLLPGGDSAVGLHLMHRLLAGLLGLLLAATLWSAIDERRDRRLVAATLTMCGLYAVQVIVGAANIWTELADGVVAAHLALAALLWCGLVLISAMAYYLPSKAREPGRVERGAAEWAR